MKKERPVPAEIPYHKITVDTMRDCQLKNLICRDIPGGCKACECYDFCRIGKEAVKRGLVA